MSESSIGRDNMGDRRAPAGSGAVAIIGMSCLFPGAPDVSTFWRNIVDKVDAVTDPPPESWHNDRYYDPDSGESDRIYCKRGGYLGPLVSFDPLAHGIPPVAVGGEPDQWLALQVAVDAMADAGYSQLDEAVRHRTAVILGKGTYLNGGNAMAVQHGLVLGQTLALLKSLHPEYTDEEIEALRQELKKSLPPLGPETVPGLIPNIIVGRIANRLDLMGPTYTVDAACASSLVAVQMALRDLADGACDLALVGGSQVWIPSPTMNIFCQLGALSRRQQIRPFDKEADGTLLGEGIGMVVLKRLEDAERDGDRIYAVIRGVGVASDGRGATVMAPRVEGEAMALRRAYEAAGVSPRTVGLIEAHGTGTPVGDVVEIQALTRVFGPRGDGLPWCALGSVKSMISHTIPASGVAGIIKTALALHHKVLPPMLNCTEPNPRLELEKTPFYLNTETRPWIHGGTEPRRAGVNSFGFGGINAHAVLEEYVPRARDESRRAMPGPSRSVGRGVSLPASRPDHRPDWESEVCILGAESPGQLLEQVRRLEGVLSTALSGGRAVRLKDLAYTLNRDLMDSGEANASRLAVVASSVADLHEKLGRAARALEKPGCRRIRETSGLYYEADPMGREGKLVFLFPGEGSQYPNMLADLCLHFPEARECFDQSDRAYAGHPRGYVPSDVIFPRPSLGGREEWAEGRLWTMDGAIEAVLTADLALLAILDGLGLRPDAIVGHSSGEYAALRASGILDLRTEEQWAWFAHELNGDYERAAARGGVPRAVLLAIGAGRERAESIAREAGGAIHVAMDNCPHQVVLAGEAGAIERAMEIVRREGLMAERLSFDRPYHTPMFAPFAEHLRQVVDRLPMAPAQIPLHSCTTIAPFPTEPAEIRSLMIEHWLRPVEFRRTIEALYDEGARVFVEVGPRGNLSAFVEDILRGRPSCAVPADTPRRPGLTQLNHLAGLLTAQGIDMDLLYLHRRRDSEPISLDDLATDPAPTRPAVRLKLGTGFPEMQLSEEAAGRLRAAGSRERVYEKSPEAFGRVLSEHRGTSPGLPPVLGEHPTRPSAQASHTPLETPQPQDPPSPELPDGPTGDLPTIREIPSVPEAIDRPTMPGAFGVAPPFDAGAMTSAIGSYFRTMEQFLGLQQRVIRGLLDPARPTHADAGGQASASGVHAADVDYPMLGEIVTWTPGDSLVARRTFDPAEDLYLDDHTLGRDVSHADPDLRALAIMPMTMSLEILAEAASALRPGRTVIGLRDVRAARWIAFEDGPQTLQVTARRRPGEGDEVEVQLRNLTEDERAGDPPKSPVIEATVLFGDEHPRPVAAMPSSLDDGRPSRLHPEALYEEHMFHGPSWRGVAAIEQTGPSRAVARLRVLPIGLYFRSNPEPRFVLDPAVLDAAGQVIGFWTIENLDRGKIVFPFRLQTLDIYGPPRAPGEALTCTAAIRLLTDHHVRSDIDVLDADGRPWMRLIGWEDKRFDLPDALTPLILPASRADVSERWLEPVAHLPLPDSFECRILRAEFPSDRGFWRRVWMHRMLGRSERAQFRRVTGPESRQLEWLAGRAAAKEAVRHLLESHHGLDLPLADIEILPDPWGRPRPAGTWRERVDGTLSVSIGHVDGLAVAVAGLAASRSDERLLGVEVQAVRPLAPDFVDAAFDGREVEILEELPIDFREEWMLRAWCAREAVAKALGPGLVAGPRPVRLAAVDVASETVCVRLGDRLIAPFPGLASSELTVTTGRHGDLIVATTLCEPFGAEPVDRRAITVLQ